MAKETKVTVDDTVEEVMIEKPIVDTKKEAAKPKTKKE